MTNSPQTPSKRCEHKHKMRGYLFDTCLDCGYSTAPSLPACVTPSNEEVGCTCDEPYGDFICELHTSPTKPDISEDELEQILDNQQFNYYDTQARYQKGILTDNELEVQIKALTAINLDALQTLIATKVNEARVDEQKAVSEWLTDANHVGTIKDLNNLRLTKLKSLTGGQIDEQ